MNGASTGLIGVSGTSILCSYKEKRDHYIFLNASVTGVAILLITALCSYLHYLVGFAHVYTSLGGIMTVMNVFFYSMYLYSPEKDY